MNQRSEEKPEALETPHELEHPGPTETTEAPPPPETPAGEEAPQDALTQKLAEAQDQYLRLCAEFENYKKRTAREAAEQIRFANERLLAAVLPLVDNLERALAHARESQSLDGLVEGVALTLKEFNGVLERFGVRAIATRGQPFNPAWHEAMMQIETSEHASHTIVEEFQKGYLLNDRVLRPAKVVVAKRTEPESGEGEAKESP